MAAVIKCECCGKVVDYRDAKHVRVHRMNDATHFASNALLYCDVCNDCHMKFIDMLKHMEADK